MGFTVRDKQPTGTSRYITSFNRGNKQDKTKVT